MLLKLLVEKVNLSLKLSLDTVELLLMFFVHKVKLSLILGFILLTRFLQTYQLALQFLQRSCSHMGRLDIFHIRNNTVTFLALVRACVGLRHSRDTHRLAVSGEEVFIPVLDRLHKFTVRHVYISQRIAPT